MKCSFCGEAIKEATGKIFVEKSGKEKYFCSTKCEKNLFKLGRSPLHTKWTKRYNKNDS